MNILKRIIKFIINSLLILVGIYSIIIITQKILYKNKTPNIFGYKNYIVISGSMSPVINAGDLIFVKESNDFKENDIVAYRTGNSVITHRIIDVIEDDDEKIYITKGDANNKIDSELLEFEDIEGKYLFKISKIGNIILFLKSSLGIRISLIIIGIGLFIYLFRPNKKNKKGKKVQNEKQEYIVNNY